MPDFYYEARDETGQTISGRIRAMDVRDAIGQLEANDWDVVSVRTVPRPTAEPAELEDESDEMVEDGLIEVEIPPMSRQQSAEVAGHLANVMEAELPLVPGLLAFAKELPDGKVRRALRAMAAQLEAGRSLESVLESRHVPADLLGLVRAGLRSGHASEVLNHYVAHTQQMMDLRRRIALAWGYPLVLIGCAAAIVAFFLLYFIPKFTEIFEDFGIELPAMTVSVVWLSRGLLEHWRIILGIAAGVGLAAWILWRYVLTETQRRRFIWRLPIVGTMIRYLAFARFARLLGFLIENQIPLPEALRLAGQGTGDAELYDAALDLADRVESGRPLTRTDSSRRFPATFLQMLAQVNGQKPRRESVKTLAEACLASARMFERQARVIAARIAALCPPLIVIFTGVMLGYLVIALLMPLLKLLNDLA